MRSARQFSLGKNEIAFLNGGIVRAPSGASLTVLNDAHFLVERFLIREEDARTPLRRLYLKIQCVLQSPPGDASASRTLEDAFGRTAREIGCAQIGAALAEAKGHLRAERPLEAMKTLRRAFPLEDARL
ncbi:flagellar biosynthesis repressor FlbT [Salinarimonas ramus]|uniref:Flagellar protein FlbT n=1 Tax=Salinarimonas ramus TaxID=690164 RepID=A0A917VAH2_9HYPH|nr:flagellar biosynthesis repressor FlbT [Salinarimonas ramus]GGK55249.1 hypothetical protein GCM10011322_47400 [Salinarimonas ramus]